jgi:hypothetical protein
MRNFTKRVEGAYMEAINVAEISEKERLDKVRESDKNRPLIGW